MFEHVHLLILKQTESVTHTQSAACARRHTTNNAFLFQAEHKKSEVNKYVCMLTMRWLRNAL